jgi:membrane associated rhomboid family serine protease
MDDLFCQLSEQTARTFSLVLSAAGIPHQRTRLPEGWRILIPESYRLEAQRQIEQYLKENPPATENSTAYHLPLQKSFSAAWVALILIAVHAAKGSGQPAEALIRAFGASTDRIVEGELYRLATALLLHADTVHLLANLVGIGIFGTALCTLTGAGAAWAMILFSGVAGNLLNAWVKDSSTLSIGASTAIFGALGALCVLTFFRRYKVSVPRFRALLPFFGGIALLGLLGSAEGTDVMAHLFGFLSGMAIAIPWAILIKVPPARKYQMLFSGFSLAIILWAWAAGHGG